MKDLIILGVGVHELEMVEIVERVNRAEPRWNLLGFISPDGKRLGDTLQGLPVLGAAETIAQHPQACLVPGNAWPRSLSVPRERLVSLIDPTCFVSRTARVGLGCVFYPHCYVGLNARVGDFVFCLSGCIINHDGVIEDRTVMASHVTLAGCVHVEADCYMGQSCAVRQHHRVGRGSLVGMGAVVVDDVPPGIIVAGNPARKLRDRS